MNVFNVGICENCGSAVEVQDAVMVHGADNFEFVKRLIEAGMTVEQCKEVFCSSCGEYKGVGECNCMND